MSLLAAIDGVLDYKEADAALVRVGGLTVRVFVPAHDLTGLATGKPVHLQTHLVVREDDLQLYGFVTDQGRRLFEALLTVSGVGPRGALALLSTLSPEDALSAIAAGDGQTLSRAQGIGKRTAERIILELKGKLEEDFPLPIAGVTPSTGGGGDPALQWLMSLGFSMLEARQALSVEREPDLPVEERVRRALQRIGQA